MKNIEEYILLPLKERQEHLDLSKPCIERGGVPGIISIYMRGLLAHILDTTIPLGHKILACHACNNSKCGNPSHLYWGTNRENQLDAMACGRQKGTWTFTVKKYGLEKAIELTRKAAKQSSAGAGGKGKPKSEEHKKALSESLRRRYQDGSFTGMRGKHWKKKIKGTVAEVAYAPASRAGNTVGSNPTSPTN